jgi:hypothetical protein
MGLNTRFVGDYTVTSVTNGNFNANVSALNIYGNLNVFGKTTQQTIANSSITNNFITLNDGFIGPPLLNSGIIVNRGDGANVILQYSETVTRWQITNDGVAFGNILTDLGSGSGSTLFDNNVAIKNSSINPVAIPGFTILHTQHPTGPGESGVYVTNQTYSAQELILKTKALIYTVLL